MGLSQSKVQTSNRRHLFRVRLSTGSRLTKTTIERFTWLAFGVGGALPVGFLAVSRWLLHWTIIPENSQDSFIVCAFLFVAFNAFLLFYAATKFRGQDARNPEAIGSLVISGCFCYLFLFMFVLLTDGSEHSLLTPYYIYIPSVVAVTFSAKRQFLLFLSGIISLFLFILGSQWFYHLIGTAPLRQVSSQSTQIIGSYEYAYTEAGIFITLVLMTVLMARLKSERVVVFTAPAVPSHNAAVLSGVLADLGTAKTVEVSFQYGLDTNYGKSSQVSILRTAGCFSATVGDLLPSAKYHYRAKVDVSKETSFGEDMQFTT
jgi:hypothetical protein